jgi:uncharacterized protein YybS (DUF2232 family)
MKHHQQTITERENLMPTEQTIILAIIGMVGLFATATVYQRANRISSRYYSNKINRDLIKFNENGGIK